MRVKTLLLVGTALVASGCYTYLPTSAADVRPGTPVRMRITGDQARALYEQRLTDDRLLAGTLVERSGDGFLVDTPVGHNDAQRGMRAVLQRVAVPERDVLEIEQRTLNKARTGAVMAAGMVAAGVVIALQSSGGGDGDDGPGPGTPESRRIPLLRFALPFF